jgi:hypothetical protein
MADLVPTAAPIAVGDQGAIGGKTFRVLGRLQLDHGRGPWDEWYLGFDDESWGWLARAEGRWYLTFERAAGAAPSWDALTPSSTTSFEGTGSVRWVVTERGGSATLSAEGELPFAVDPRGSGRYVDLEAEGSAFATLDFGDGSRAVQLFAGRELAPNELTLKQTAVGPRPSEKVEVARLSCPACGAPLAIFVPSQTERCGCEACGALLDHQQGALKLLEQLDPPAVRPLIALGSEGTLLGTRRTVIGFLQRSLKADGDLYTFREYLLHSESGYSWLLEENHHWLHVSPVSSGSVVERGDGARYDGRIYRAFAKAEPVVDFVIGEFYWKVQQGDRSLTKDFIAPPRLLSVERTDDEVSWSEGEYVAPATLVRAFALAQPLPTPIGVAAAQPNPHLGRGADLVFALLAALWFVLGLAYELHREPVLVDTSLTPTHASPGVPLAPPPTQVEFSPPFEVAREATVLEVELGSALTNAWLEVQASLVPEQGGEPRELVLVAERYQGSDNGEAWSEGDGEASGYFGRVPAGRYSMRFVSRWQPNDNGWAAESSPPSAHLRVIEGSRSPACCAGTLLLIALPWLLSRVRRIAFEQRRRENESL